MLRRASGGHRGGLLAGFVRLNPPPRRPPHPQQVPPRAGEVLGSPLQNAGTASAAEADLPPSASVGPSGMRERDAADRGPPHPTLNPPPDPAMPDVPDTHLSSLHGLALEIRRD